MNKSKPKKVRIVLDLPEYVVKWLTDEAKKRKISRSALVEEILRDYLEKHEKGEL